jgi:nicotinamidase-related amidase
VTLPQNTALIVIDVQQGLDDPKYGERNNPDAEAHISRLLAAWRAAGRPLFHVQHHSIEPDSPLRPERPGVAVKPGAAPLDGEPVIIKHGNSAFVGTDLDKRLSDMDIDTLVMCGLTTPHCVSTSVRMASDYRYSVYLPADATAAHPATGYNGQHFTGQQVHEAALAHLHNEFATVTTTDAILSELD